MFEDLNYEELKRRANSRLPEPVVAALEIADLVQVDPELSDILLPAFAARRIMLMQRQQGMLTLVGRDGAPTVRRVIEYAERSRIPYRWLDPADERQKEAITATAAEGSGVTVVVRGRHILHEPSVAEVARALGLELAAGERDPVDLIIAGLAPPAFRQPSMVPPKA